MLNPTEVKRAWTLLYKTKPKLLVVSHPCAKDGTVYAESDREYVQLLELAVDMCVAQMKAGRFFVFEQVANASSWKSMCVQRLA